jgi:transcription antitermination factor NusG
MEQKRWYAVYTRSRAEKKTFESLVNEGVEAYIPLYKTLRQWSDRKKMVTLPLIPSYVFVKIFEKDYRKVLATDGAVAFIKFEGQMVAIPDRQIEDMRRLVDSGSEIKAITEHVEKGDVVRIASGPLRGTEGEIIEMQGKQKFVLRINIGYTLIVNIQGADIIKV